MVQGKVQEMGKSCKNTLERMIGMIKKQVNGEFIKGNWEQELFFSFNPVQVSHMELIAHQEEPWVSVVLGEGQHYLVSITTGKGISLVNQLLRMLLVRIRIEFVGFQQYANLIRDCMGLIQAERSAAA